MESLRDRIIRHEGIRLKLYKDSLGYLTIGVGRCIELRGISEDEAFYMLNNDLLNSKREVNENMPWVLGLDEMRLNVLYEMSFQLGFNRLSLFKKMLSAMREGDFNRAADEMLDSAWHRQTPKRCEELAKIIRNGF
jgi:lysozyme